MPEPVSRIWSGPASMPSSAKLAREEPAQRQRAARGAVVGQDGAVPRAGEPRAAPGGARRSASTRPAASRSRASARPGRHRATGATPRTDRSPGRAAAATSASASGGQAARDVEARARPRPDQPLRRQPVVGLDHGRGRDAHRRGEAADRGQPLAGRERARPPSAAGSPPSPPPSRPRPPPPCRPHASTVWLRRPIQFGRIVWDRRLSRASRARA